MRTNRITIFVNQSELDAIDCAKGSAKRGSFLRNYFTNRTQKTATASLNREAWLVLSKCAGTLETLAKYSAIGRADAEATKLELTAFREALICTKNTK